MTIKTKTHTVQYVDLGPVGHFKPGKEVSRYQEQFKLVQGLKQVTTGCAAWTLSRREATAQLAAALTHVPPEYKDTKVPPSLEQRLGFTKYAVLQRILQDLTSTGPITTHIAVLTSITDELERGLGMFLVGAERAPDANTERANELAAHAEEISRQHRAYKGIR